MAIKSNPHGQIPLSKLSQMLMSGMIRQARKLTRLSINTRRNTILRMSKVETMYTKEKKLVTMPNVAGSENTN